MSPEGIEENGEEEYTEYNFKKDTIIFLISQSKFNDMMLYIPAALQGILFIIQMREIESAFIET